MLIVFSQGQVIRKHFIIICIIASLLLFFVNPSGLSLHSTVVSAANPTTVTVNAPTKVNPGSNFAVTISVVPGQQVAGLQLDLSYNSTLVDFLNIIEGSLFSQGGNATYFSQGTNANGSINNIIGVITTPGGSVTSTGTFITLNFAAKTIGGNCAITLSNLILGDKNGAALPVTLVNDQVVINRAPSLNAIGNKNVNEGNLLQFVINGVDPDNDTLTYSAANLPAGANFNASTRTFSWTPNYAQSGVYATVTFSVSDGTTSSQQIINITVNQPFPDWDTNNDGSTNILDMSLIGQHWNETGTLGWISQDVNHDLVINVLDMVLIGQHWTG